MELILGDCLEKMQEIEAKSIDLILCDLPYGVTQNDKDKRIDLERLWIEYKRIIKDRGAILLFCQGLFYIDLVNSNRAWFRYDLIWDKELITGFLNAKRQPLRRHEQIAVFYKKRGVYNPQMWKGQPLHSQGGDKWRETGKKTINYGRYTPNDDRAGSRDKYPTSILKFKKVHASKSVHPTEKSVDLCEYLVKTYSKEGAIVLDNCMGSGTTGVAVIRAGEGRKFIGIEIDEKYYNLACNRIKDEKEKGRDDR